MEVKYIQKTNGFLKNGHKYEIKINKRPSYHVYDIMILTDLTDNKEVNKMINLTSPISIKRYFGVDDFIMTKPENP